MGEPFSNLETSFPFFAHLTSWFQSPEPPVCRCLLFRVAFGTIVCTLQSAGHLLGLRGSVPQLPKGTAGRGGSWLEIIEDSGRLQMD